MRCILCFFLTPETLKFPSVSDCMACLASGFMGLSKCFFILLSPGEIFLLSVQWLTGLNTDILNLDNFYAGIFDVTHLLSFKQYWIFDSQTCTITVKSV